MKIITITLTLLLMDFQKAKIYLDKLNREFARLSKDPENTMRLDIDIMASYAREFYDAINSESSVYVAPKPEPAPPRTTSRPTVIEPIVLKPTPAPPPPMVVEVPPPAPPPPVREIPPAPAPEPVFVAPKAPAPMPSAPTPAGMEVLFEEKQAKELSEKLAESAIPDLRKAIALNDRLLFTSELFAGDGKTFDSALSALNECASYEQARDHIIHHYAVQYSWTDKKRLDSAKTFIKLVRRRYK